MSLMLLAALAVVQSAPINCTDADHAAFNFWVGDWIVSDTATGADIAVSHIASIAGGCAIEETYHQALGPGGAAMEYRGHSYSAFDAADGRWKQFYIDNGGAVASMVGGISEGAMVLTVDQDPIQRRMTVRPVENGKVRQSGERSTDGGQTWTPTFDFTYRPGLAPSTGDD